MGGRAVLRDAEITKIKFGSEAYFAILDAKPELAEAFKLGNAMIILTATGKAVVIGTEGEEKLDAAKLAALFTAAEKKPEVKKEEPAKVEEKKEEKK